MQQVFKVQGMTCGHCVRAITQALQAVDGEAQVQVDLAAGEVRVHSTRAADELIAAIASEGYLVN
ncbi:heavy-metal-associated domain-containing protein [Phytopseudomonas dryadis]|uniref:Copper resistance protein CopZ n=1 Tax=Phytopseudomonas dryadis TaxID=2487520 RepID=A0A4Q9R0G3_9GAMM|nr:MULTISPECIES: cation transporter [Pseudomonas]TBU90946.1 copper resistance protein CopZ [Pseudomonas dryadis]TBV08899.1 copper resistance protein CopZ [Pseudomonas dryadis]TBV15084.1 copper resistance protein CopZ [Pseudomonas sp. FRB 230]